jgi:hypothetical protein
MKKSQKIQKTVYPKQPQLKGKVGASWPDYPIPLDSKLKAKPDLSTPILCYSSLWESGDATECNPKNF